MNMKRLERRRNIIEVIIIEDLLKIYIIQSKHFMQHLGGYDK